MNDSEQHISDTIAVVNQLASGVTTNGKKQMASSTLGIDQSTVRAPDMAGDATGLNSSWLLAMDNGTIDNSTLRIGEESATGANIASPIVMFLAGLLGNVLALVVLHRTKTEIRSMMFYTLVAALTWNDLIGIILTSPVTMAAYINGREMPAGDRLCRFNGFVMVCFGLSTPLIVCTMAIERSLALKCTYFYSKYCTPTSARVVVVGLWAFVLLFGALPLFGVGSYSLQYPKTWCFLDFHTSVVLDMVYGYVYAILNLLIVVLMTFCNLVVMATLCQVRDTRRKFSSASLNSTLLYTDAVEEKMRPPQHVRRRQQRDVELQMIWLVCAITTIFAVCWVPLMVHIVLTLSVHNQSPVLGLVAIRLASLNQTLNPWLYVILRKALLTRIRDACCRCLKDDELDHLRQFRPKNYSPRLNQIPNTKRQNYVHVRHQLCPSSQYVGRQNEAASLAEGSHGKGSKSGSGSRSGGRVCSLSGSDARSGEGSDSIGLCSVCRARAMDLNYSWGGGSSHRSPSHASCSGGSRTGPAVKGPPPSPRGAENFSHSVADRAGEPNDTPDGIYVDLFRHNPDLDTSPLRPPAESQVLACDSAGSRRGDGQGHKGEGQSCRDEGQSRRGEDEDMVKVKSSDKIREVLLVQDNSLSEADDHGYVSKVSTDSSRLSTPEALRQKPDKMLDLLPDTSDVFEDGCGGCKGDSSSGQEKGTSSRKHSESSGR